MTKNNRTLGNSIAKRTGEKVGVEKCWEKDLLPE